MDDGSAPRIYVLSRPQWDLREVGRLLADLGAEWRRSPGASPAEELVELAGRMCYLSFGAAQSSRSNEAYIANLIDKGHESVLEHAAWSFVLTGVTRAFTHQLVRHRVGLSYSQLSQQYADHSAAIVQMPPQVSGDPELESKWREAMASVRELYDRIVTADPDVPDLTSRERLRASRSAARLVLPEGTETKIFVTANARALRHFLEIRGSIEGDPEMRAVSALILREVKADAPSLFVDFDVEKLGDGSPIVLRHR